MYPRPKARGRPLPVPTAGELFAEVAAIRKAGGEPPAILTGPREWAVFRRDRHVYQYWRCWVAGEETFAGVPVVIRRGLDAPHAVASQDELEEALLP